MDIAKSPAAAGEVAEMPTSKPAGRVASPAVVSNNALSSFKPMSSDKTARTRASIDGVECWKMSQVKTTMVDKIRGARVTPAVIDNCCAGIGPPSPTKPTGEAAVLIEGTLIAAALLKVSDRQRFSNVLPADAGPMFRRKSGNAVAARLSAHPDPVIIAGEVAARVNISTA